MRLAPGGPHGPGAEGDTGGSPPAIGATTAQVASAPPSAPHSAPSPSMAAPIRPPHGSPSPEASGRRPGIDAHLGRRDRQGLSEADVERTASRAQGVDLKLPRGEGLPPRPGRPPRLTLVAAELAPDEVVGGEGPHGPEDLLL